MSFKWWISECYLSWGKVHGKETAKHKKRRQKGHFRGWDCGICLPQLGWGPLFTLCHYEEWLFHWFEGSWQVLQVRVTLEDVKAFGCGQISDHHDVRGNTQGGPFVGITTVTSNKNVLCLENVVWTTHCVKKTPNHRALKGRCILCRREKKIEQIEQIFKAVFLVKEREKSCQHFRNKWSWPLEPGWVNPAFSKVTTSLEALVQPSEPRPRIKTALKHLSKHYSSRHRVQELPLKNSKFSHVNSSDERLHEITQRPSRVIPSFSPALLQTSSKLSCVLRLILVSAHSRAK